ncbi:hypothetical protein CQ017_11625 [Arthrobacter sp. MYb224]|uniref:DUF1801 domain-containing protein n=1 Tax=Arthrobacter sp. MYb224 TaxID=1848600 RepID=UPI000CFB00CC|nr:DUF1801 domain-containing protein [Arthrobacter sp. MYb224]PQZ98258.1 hypothetical protein CQ017_11625 [Arthrobacter sp. MYb224]
MATKQPAMSPSEMPVSEVLDRAPGTRRAEAEELLSLYQEITAETPVVWAGKIIGFGEYEYFHANGRSARAPLMAFAPGSAKHTLYLQSDFAEKWPELLAALGPHRASKACLYLGRLSKIDLGVLRELLEASHTLARTEAGQGPVSNG